MRRSISQSMQRNILAGLVATALVLAGCSSRSLSNAPVEDRGTGAQRSGATPVAPPAGSVDPVKPLPGIENAGKPGYYTVKPGDTLIRIGLDTGQNFRDIVRWNNLENPNLIEVGQVLRIVSPLTPLAGDSSAVVTRPVSSGTATTTTAVAPLRPASAASTPTGPSTRQMPGACAPQTAGRSQRWRPRSNQQIHVGSEKCGQCRAAQSGAARPR